MRHPGIVLLVLFCSAALSASAQAPLYQNEPSGAYLRSWLVCGPITAVKPAAEAATALHFDGFLTDFLTPLGGEKEAAPKPGDKVAFDGGEAQWSVLTSDTDAVYLDAALGTKENVVAYAYCEIDAAQATTAVCALGTNDGGRLWLNGEVVWDLPAGRALQLDEDMFPLLLKKGRNRLLLKIEERGNLWGFACRLLPLTPEALTSKFRLFDVQLDGEAKPVLAFRHAESLTKALIDKARLGVRRRTPPMDIVWEDDWTGKYRMPLPIDASDYGEYDLEIAATLVGGMEHTMTLPFTAGVPVDHALFADGQSDYRIVVGADASDSEKWAAAELQHWLQETGAPVLPIVDDTAPTDGPRLIVGFNKHAAALFGPDAKAPADGDESYIYRNIGPNILLWGGRERGSMYAVLAFLERELGVRWYTPRVTVTPKKDKYVFRTLFHTEKAGIRVRNDFYFEAFDPTWAAHNKVNGAMGYREQPGGIESYWGVHTFYPFVPPSEFFATHPEYYSLIDGQRTADYAQLCLTNPDVLRIITERLLKTMREQPQYLIYCVSQNDWAKPCQCEACQEIAKREGSESGPVVWFVNQVADAVAKEFPDKFVGTLAYQYTRKPPKTLRPRDNVVIRLCSIECCFAHDFNTCPENASFIEDLRGWSAIAPHMYIWDYVVNFSHYIMPYPNFRVLQSNIKSFRDNNAIGIMEQAAYQSRGGEFAELRAYVLAKLLWDPECDVEAVINDFMYGYYGRAGQYVRAYFDLLHNRITPETHIHLGLRPEDKLFSDEFVREATLIFDEAEKVADNEEIRQRVEMARLPIFYLKCKRTPAEARIDGTYARFCEIVQREGITCYAEAGQPHREAFHQEVENAR